MVEHKNVKRAAGLEFRSLSASISRGRSGKIDWRRSAVRSGIASLALAGCSPLSEGAWRYSDEERDLFNRDRYECMKETPQRVRPGTSTQFGTIAPSTGPDVEYFSACLQARGWEPKWWAK